MDVPKSNFDWAPLGIRFDAQGNLIYTDVSPNYHSVHIIPAASLTSLSTFNPKISYFGTEGKEPGQFSFPNTAVVDSRGNFYISDGNNYRLSEFSVDRTYKTFFGFGNVRSGVNLPRGLWIDQKELLHVADAIGNTIRVYDVSGAEPVYAYAFGSEGTDAGEFSNPTDICIDSTGRVYIADRSNGRIQIWSY
jgi:sugar lactone lactonase YvrE